MLAEALAVIGRDDDQRALELSGAAQRVEQLTDHRVGIGDLRIVRLVLRRERLRSTVGLVRIVQMHPCEPGTGSWELGAGSWELVAGSWELVAAGWGLGAGRTQDPRGCRPHHLLGAAFGPLGHITGRLLAVTIVVDVEAAVQAEARIEHEGADERAGAVA